MKNSLRYAAIAASLLLSAGAFAQTSDVAEEAATPVAEESGSKYKGNLSLSVDLVSTTLWRGGYLTGVSLQPGIGFDIAGFSVGAWGSTDFNYSLDGYSELDFMIGYSNWGVSLLLTDYCWTNGNGEFDYFGKYTDNHFLELSVGFDFGEYFEKVPIYINANTMLYGANYDGEGKQAYSTYLEIGYSYAVRNIVDLNLAVGAAIEPEGACLYSPNSGFSVVNINVGASHDFNIKDICNISVGADIVYNPATEGIYFGAGVGFSM